MAQRTIARMYDHYEDARTVVSDLEAAGIPHSDISLVANAAARDARGSSGGDYDAGGHGAEPYGVGTSGAGVVPDDRAGMRDRVAADDRVSTEARVAAPDRVAAHDRVAVDDRAAATDAGHTATGTGGAAGALLGSAVGGGVGLLAGIGALAIPGVGPVVAAGWLVATLAGAGVGAASGGLLGSLTGAGVGHDEAHVYAEGVRGGGSLVTVRVDENQAAAVEEVMARRDPVNWRQRRTEYGPEWTGFNETSASRVRGAPTAPGDVVAGRPDVARQDVFSPAGEPGAVRETDLDRRS